MAKDIKSDANPTVDIHRFLRSQLNEVAGYIKEDTLAWVNEHEIDIEVRETFYTKYVKRFFDIVISLLALIVSAPINMVIGIVTIFDVGFPLIFKQSRIGKNFKTFYIYKFRNMTNEKDANGELLPPAQRVTKWGKFVRRTSLDELLNFVSILKGDMSLIGPRPLLSVYGEFMHKRHLKLYAVRPGLECPHYEKLDHPMTWQERFDSYVWYAQNVSFAVDVKLIWRIVEMVFSRESASKRSVSANGSFLGYDRDGQVIHSKAVPKKYVDMFLENHGFSDVEEVYKAR